MIVNAIGLVHAATEPPRGITPAEALRRYIHANPGRKVCKGFTVETAPDRVGLYLDAGRDTYHAAPKFIGDANYVLVTNCTRSSVNFGRTLLEIAHVDSVQDLLRKMVQAVRSQLPGNHRAKAAAEPQQDRNLKEILADHIGNLRVPIPGGDAELTRAMPEIRMNSREWDVTTSWLLHIGTYRNMVEIVACITEHGTVLQLRGVGTTHRFQAPDMTLRGLTLARADADNAVAARVLLAGCRKLLSQMQQRATAAAEPRPNHTALSPAQVLGRWYDRNPDPITFRNDIKLVRYRAPFRGMRIEAGDCRYLVQPDHYVKGCVRVQDLRGRPAERDVATITEVTGIPDLLRQILKPILARHPRQAQAAAEPQPHRKGSEFSRVWLRFREPKVITVDGVKVTLEGDDTIPPALEIRMPDGVRYSAMALFRKHTDIQDVQVQAVGRHTHFPVIRGDVPASQMLPRILSLVVQDWKQHTALAAAAAMEHQRVSGIWKGYCVRFQDGLVFPTDTGCKGTCQVQYEPSTGKVYQHGPNGYEHHGRTIQDWAGTSRIPVPSTPVPEGMSLGIRNGYSLRFVDGTQVTTETGIRGTSAVYRDPRTGVVYESGPKGWYELRGVTTPVDT